MGGPFRAFLDASVLYPVSLRNLLMRLTLAGLFQARWSPHVHEEWVKAVLRDHPHIPRARLHELRDAMDERAEDSLVTGCPIRMTATCWRRRFSRAPISSSPATCATFRRPYSTPTASKPSTRMNFSVTCLINPPIGLPELLGLFERLGLSETVVELRRLIGL